ncbi:hypothetical protein ACFX2B_025290 [Malus domestica]
MLAFIFYRIDDLPEYLIVWQLMKANGKIASSKAGNKNSSERRMMMNADDVPAGPLPSAAAADSNEVDMETVLGLGQRGLTPWRSKEEQDLWFGGKFQVGLESSA